MNDDDDADYGNDLERRRGQFGPAHGESLVPLVGLERHKPNL